MAHLPKSRQTLLFSATQTKSIKDLARLSLKEPISLSASAAQTKEGGAEGEEEAESGEGGDERALWVTPKGLEQHYAVVELHRKLDVLFSFIKTHLKSKIIVFMSSCKQVRCRRLRFACRSVKLTASANPPSGPLCLRDVLQAAPGHTSPRTARQAEAVEAADRLPEVYDDIDLLPVRDRRRRPRARFSRGRLGRPTRRPRGRRDLHPPRRPDGALRVEGPVTIACPPI